jgi:hypothetical protein
MNKESGNSLAEFAVTTAMMATLATTAAPKFSGVGEGAKEKKTFADIDKIVTASNNFYNDKVSMEGRGRFPGQDRFDDSVPAGTHDYSMDQGQHNAEDNIRNMLAIGLQDFSNYTFDPYEPQWASVFGTTTLSSRGNLMIPINNNINDSEDIPNIEEYEDDPALVMANTFGVGAIDYLTLFGGNPIRSPFQDGSYIYLVIPGSGSGQFAQPPILYIADLESPKDFWRKLQP